MGLLAGCLFVAPHHMSKATYVAVTDMMLTMWVLASLMCADRILFHPDPNGKRVRWVVGLWATMILGAMTKGWGVLNLILVGGTLGLATAMWEGFGPVGEVRGFARKVGAVALLVLRRWWTAIRATRLGWGILAMVVVLAPVWIGMFIQGGEEFRRIVHYEFWSRVTGRGETVPHGSSVPPILHLVYYMFPTSFFAIGAMALIHPRRWFARGSPILLPLCWIIAVVAPFSFTHGFRHDYLLPCYPAGALMAAWAVEELLLRRREDRLASGVRHLFAGVAIVVALFAALVSGAFLFHEHLPESLTKNLRLPPIVEPETWWILVALVALGAGGVVVAIRASLRWRIRVVVGVAVVGMLGAVFVYRHILSRPARDGDGERMLLFARKVRPVVGDDDFAVARARKLATELYLGRFGMDVLSRNSQERLAERFQVRPAPVRPGSNYPGPRQRARVALELLIRSEVPWLITCDYALVELGAGREDPRGEVKLGRKGKGVRFRTLPQDLGTVELVTQPVVSQRRGRMYLIRLDREKLARRREEKMYRHAGAVDFESGRQD